MNADWPDPIEGLNIQGRSPIVLLCEHASNHLPPDYENLGLADTDLQRHIAWDIGAAVLTRDLSRRLDAAAFLGTFSRLLIDLNRPLGTPGSIVRRSETTDVPGNANLAANEIRRREDLIFKPYHQCIRDHLDIRQTQGLPTILVSLHSFTPVFLGEPRTWEAGVLFADAKNFGLCLVEALQAAGLKVGANVPYKTSRAEDYAIPVHGDDRGLPAVMIEMRQDLLSDIRQVTTASETLANALLSLIGKGLSGRSVRCRAP